MKRLSAAAMLLALFIVTAQRAACATLSQPQDVATPAPSKYHPFQCEHASLQGAASGGDLYNEFANDGEERNGSYRADAAITCGALSTKLEARESRFQTENAGPGSQTLFCTLDGGFAKTPYFIAAESTVDLRVERSVGRQAFNVGVSYLTTSTNYGYPHLRGLGFGFEKLSPSRPGLGPYGSLFYFPAATGEYRVTEVASPDFGHTIHSSFSIVLADIGVVWQPRASRSYLYAGYDDEVRTPIGGPLCMLCIRSSPYAGMGLRF
jgi:hypothetical protein